MAETVFDVSTSTVPGPALGNVVRVNADGGPHGQVMIWPPAASFQDAPVLFYEHGGAFHNPGYRAMEGAPQGVDMFQLWTDLSAAGWVIVSYDPPPAPSRASYQRSSPPHALFPYQHLYTARAIAVLATNSHATGLYKTRLAQRLWGDGNSIGPIVSCGGSAGANAVAAAALLPQGATGSLGWGSPARDGRLAYASHRVAGVITEIMCPDFTQFHVKSADDSDTEPFQRDQLQGWNHPLTPARWSTTDVRTKAGLSPIHLLVEIGRDGQEATRWQENRSLPFLSFWSNAQGTDGFNLDPAVHNVPGRILDGSLGAGLTYDNWHDYWLATVWRAHGANHGDSRSEVYFGSNAGVNPDPSTWRPTTPAAYSALCRGWIQNKVGIPAGA